MKKKIGREYVYVYVYMNRNEENEERWVCMWMKGVCVRERCYVVVSFFFLFYFFNLLNGNLFFEIFSKLN